MYGGSNPPGTSKSKKGLETNFLILFVVDNDNVILSAKILLLNGFLKKSTKDYNKQIEIAQRILKDFESHPNYKRIY